MGMTYILSGESAFGRKRFREETAFSCQSDTRPGCYNRGIKPSALRQSVSVCNGTGDSADTGTGGRTHQNRAADYGGDDSAAGSTEAGAGEGALLLAGHMITGGERGEQKRRGGKTRQI